MGKGLRPGPYCGAQGAPKPHSFASICCQEASPPLSAPTPPTPCLTTGSAFPPTTPREGNGRELEGIKTSQLVHLGKQPCWGQRGPTGNLPWFVFFFFLIQSAVQAEKSQMGKGPCWRGDPGGEWFKGLWPQPHLSSGCSFCWHWNRDRAGNIRGIPNCAWVIYEASISNGLSPPEPGWVVGDHRYSHGHLFIARKQCPRPHPWDCSKAGCKDYTS